MISYLIGDAGCGTREYHVPRALLMRMLRVRSKTRRRAHVPTNERVLVCVLEDTQAPRRRAPCAAGGGCRPPAVQAATQYTERWCREPGRTRGSLFVGERSSPKICEDPRFDTLGVAPPAHRRTRMDHRDYLSDQQHHHHRERSVESLASLEWTRSLLASIRLAQSLFSFFFFSPSFLSCARFFYSSPFIFAERNKITRSKETANQRQIASMPFGYIRARTYQIDDPSKFEIMRITLSDVVVTPRSRGVKLALKQRCIDFGLWMLHGEYFAMGDRPRKNCSQKGERRP